VCEVVYAPEERDGFVIASNLDVFTIGDDDATETVTERFCNGVIVWKIVYLLKEISGNFWFGLFFFIGNLTEWFAVNMIFDDGVNFFSMIDWEPVWTVITFESFEASSWSLFYSFETTAMFTYGIFLGIENEVKLV